MASEEEHTEVGASLQTSGRPEAAGGGGRRLRGTPAAGGWELPGLPEAGGDEGGQEEGKAHGRSMPRPSWWLHETTECPALE